MKRLVFLLTLTLIAAGIPAGAQQSAIPTNLRISGTIDRILTRNGFHNGEQLYVVAPASGKVIGDAYIHTYWSTGAILLNEKDQIIEGYPMRYDIDADEIEIKTDGGIKVVKGRQIKSFMWLDSMTAKPAYFVSAMGYTNEDNLVPDGFFQIISDGAIPALKQTTVQVRKSDYRPEFNSGSRDTKILKKEKFYYSTNGHLYEIPSSKKKLLVIFGDKAEAMAKFINVNTLTATSESHIRAIFDHYNSLQK